MKKFIAIISSLFIPSICHAQDATVNIDLTHQIVGYLVVLLTVVAYIAAMTEETTELRKSKPMVLASALVWFIICIYYAMQGQAKIAALAFESNLLAYVEILLFILVSMTYLNTMNERGVFDVLRIFLLDRKFSYRQLFWITGILAFVLSTIINGLTVGLLMGTVILSVGKTQPRFIAMACTNVVVAANAGGTMSPLGGISTLFVWQQGILQFSDFFALTIPCIVNFLVPAGIMYLTIPKEKPNIEEEKATFVDFIFPSPEKVIDHSNEQSVLKRGGMTVIILFMTTLLITVASNIFLELPPAAGMMCGLGLLEFFNFYLTKSEKEDSHWHEKSFDMFQKVGNVDWDTLLFFYGAMMIIGAVNFVGYLDAIAHFLFGQINVTIANIMIGLSSAFIDNGTLMFAVLSMHPDISNNDWLLLTLILGVGGSLLAIGSAPGVGLLGQMKEGYTFAFHLRWMPAILLGYILSIATHFLINGF